MNDRQSKMDRVLGDVFADAAQRKANGLPPRTPDEAFVQAAITEANKILEPENLTPGDKQARYVSPDDLAPLVQDILLNGDGEHHSCGFQNMDPFYRVRRGDLAVITGIPNHGKSEWLDQVCWNLILTRNWKIAYVSLENLPSERHLIKLIEKNVNKPFYAKDEPKVSEGDIAASILQLRNNVRFLEPGDETLTVNKILNLTVDLESRGWKPDGLVIDPWNELDHSRSRFQTETEHISRSLSQFRRFCQGRNIATWIIAHPTKLEKQENGFYPVPTLYDIAGSAHWRNKVDFGFTVYRHEETVLQDGTNPVTVFISKARHKHLGQKGEAKFLYNRFTGVYREDPQ